MTFTRRTFMETTCALSAGLVFGSVAHASTKVPEKWDETCSLLVIGTGFAGLGAALESHYLGMKDILVVDKMPSAGGNSIINGGAIAAAGTDMQEKAGIKDNADLLYSDILKAGGGLAHKELARRIADESVSNYKWLLCSPQPRCDGKHRRRFHQSDARKMQGIRHQNSAENDCG